MRDPARIDRFCQRLAELWKKVPDWRFGQLISNVLGAFGKDPFYIEDDKLLEFFESYFGGGSQ